MRACLAARLRVTVPLALVFTLSGVLPFVGCVEQHAAQVDGGSDASLVDAAREEASVEVDASVDAGDASVFCPHILMRQTELEPLPHGPGAYCCSGSVET